jgi:phenylacetate-coenzyme A ligase PaaK-like adenylate-forming protein
MWGTSEGGVTAIGCLKGPGMHITDDLLIIEPVDEHGNPVPAGVRSHKIYLTNLFNPLMPLIRYEITDEVTLNDEPCACGSHHRRIHDIQGRNDDTFHYQPGVSVHPHLFRSILAKHSAISEYQIKQSPTGAQITICATGAVDTDEIAGEIAGALGRSGLQQPFVLIEPAANIPRLATGKLKRFIPLDWQAERPING